MRFAKFVGAPHFKADQHKRGFLYIDLDGEILKAYPHNSLMTLAIPSLEWIEKYKDKVWCLVEVVEDKPEYVAWCGIAPFKKETFGDPTFDEFLTDYPYVRFFFTEGWKFVISDKKDKNKFLITQEDGTKILVDRTKNKEGLTILDGKHKHEITADKDGITIKEGTKGAKVVIHKDGTIEILGGTPKLTAGVVTQKCLCSFTGGPHPDFSRAVKASK